MTSFRKQFKEGHLKATIYKQSNDANGNWDTYVVTDTIGGKKAHYFHKKRAYRDYDDRIRAIKYRSKITRNTRNSKGM